MLIKLWFMLTLVFFTFLLNVTPGAHIHLCNAQVYGKYKQYFSGSTIGLMKMSVCYSPQGASECTKKENNFH